MNVSKINYHKNQIILDILMSLSGTTQRTNRILNKYDIQLGRKPSNKLQKFLNNRK